MEVVIVGDVQPNIGRDKWGISVPIRFNQWRRRLSKLWSRWWSVLSFLLWRWLRCFHEGVSPFWFVRMAPRWVFMSCGMIFVSLSFLPVDYDDLYLLGRSEDKRDFIEADVDDFLFILVCLLEMVGVEFPCAFCCRLVVRCFHVVWCSRIGCLLCRIVEE